MCFRVSHVEEPSRPGKGAAIGEPDVDVSSRTLLGREHGMPGKASMKNRSTSRVSLRRMQGAFEDDGEWKSQTSFELDQGKPSRRFFSKIKTSWSSVIKPGAKEPVHDTERIGEPFLHSLEYMCDDVEGSDDQGVVCEALVGCQRIHRGGMDGDEPEQSPHFGEDREQGYCEDNASEQGVECDQEQLKGDALELSFGAALFDSQENSSQKGCACPRVTMTDELFLHEHEVQGPSIKENFIDEPIRLISQEPLASCTNGANELDDNGHPEKPCRASSDPTPAGKAISHHAFKIRSASDRWQQIRPGFCRYLRLYRGKVEELSRRSISVQRLLHFYHEVVIRTFNMDSSALTEDVVQNIIIPMTEEDACSWVDYLERNTEYVETTPVTVATAKSRPLIMHGNDVLMEEPTTHVVHAWKMRFVDLLVAILLDASHGKTRKLGESYEHACRIYAKVLDKPYWICCFCINQHLSICQEPHFKCRCSAPKFDDTTPQCEFDKFSAVAQKLHHRGGGMLLALERDLQSLSRAWCVDEVHYALATGMAIKPSFSTIPCFGDLREFVCEVRRCEARPRDKDRILNKIQEGTGIPAFNERITTFLQKEARSLMDAARNRSRSISVSKQRCRH